MKLRRTLLKLFLSVVAAINFWQPCFGQATGNADLQIAMLQQRYEMGSIFLNSGTLNSFRSHLHDIKKRKILDSLTDPIPKACRVFQLYLDSRFLEMLKPGWGISVLVLDFTSGRAFTKEESDSTGSVHKLEWTREDVLAVVGLVDKLLHGTDSFRELALKLVDDPHSVVSGWRRVASADNDPYVTSDSVVEYLRSLKAASDQNLELVEKIRTADARTYSEVSTFLDNTKQIDLASRAQLFRGTDMVNLWELGKESQQSPNRFAVNSLILQQARSAKNLIKLSPEQASSVAKSLQPSYYANMPRSAIPRFREY